METKEKIIEKLEGKRAEAVWELIEKSVEEIYEEKTKIPEITKEEYFENEEQVNNDKFRWLIIEHYNIEDGFYGRFYNDDINVHTKQPDFERMFEDYFSDTDGGWEKILLIDMKEKKSYLLDKNVKYTHQKVKIK